MKRSTDRILTTHVGSLPRERIRFHACHGMNIGSRVHD